MKKKKFEYKAPKPALNVVRKTSSGGFQVYQLYADMVIPLLGRRSPQGFVEIPAKSINDAFRRLELEYYE
jgi:hypothetical protein